MTEPDMRKLCIFGAGGSARETYWIAKAKGYEIAAFIDLHPGDPYDFTPIKTEDFFNPNEHNAVVALGSSVLRKKICDKIYDKFGDCFISHVMSRDVLIQGHTNIGRGTVVAQECFISCDTKIGKQSQLNVNTFIMHDVETGDYFTTAPGVRVNGKVKIGHNVYLGAGSIIKDGISICDDVIVGAGAVVVKNITEPGTYVGVPAKRIK